LHIRSIGVNIISTQNSINKFKAYLNAAPQIFTFSKGLLNKKLFHEQSFRENLYQEWADFNGPTNHHSNSFFLFNWKKL